jgi:multidrug efflux pump subunit AcrA (membrane-fusion protein)
LKDGMSADVDIITSDIPHAISIPTGAISKSGSTSYVYVVTKGLARKRTIVPGRAGDSTTLVTSGLVPGDVVVAAKTPGLIDGARVSPMPSPSSSP